MCAPFYCPVFCSTFVFLGFCLLCSLLFRLNLAGCDFFLGTGFGLKPYDKKLYEIGIIWEPSMYRTSKQVFPLKNQHHYPPTLRLSSIFSSLPWEPLTVRCSLSYSGILTTYYHKLYWHVLYSTKSKNRRSTVQQTRLIGVHRLIGNRIHIFAT